MKYDNRKGRKTLSLLTLKTDVKPRTRSLGELADINGNNKETQERKKYKGNRLGLLMKMRRFH